MSARPGAPPASRLPRQPTHPLLALPALRRASFWRVCWFGRRSLNACCPLLLRVARPRLRADCITCNSVLGWKYEVAYEESQKYKEGKFILEKVRQDRVEVCWRYWGCRAVDRGS